MKGNKTYYPHKIDRKYSYSLLKIKFTNDNNCKSESACFYKHLKKVFNYNDDLSAFLAEDFSFWSIWKNNGEKIYSFSKKEILENVNIERVSRNMFNLPQGVFFIPLNQLNLSLNSEKENLIEGVYVHTENEGNLTINLHFVGNFESVFHKYPSKIVLDEDIVSNWNYFLIIPKDKENVYVNDIIENELRIFKDFLQQNLSKDDKLYHDNLNDFKTFIAKTIRPVISSLLLIKKNNYILPKSEKEKAIEFISKIDLPLNISRTNYIRNMLNCEVITLDDIPKEILENYKFTIKETINVDFQDTISGWINFTIKAGDKMFESMFSCVFDPLLDLKHWLEAIIIGVSQTSFSYDTEGSEFKFDFERNKNNEYLFTFSNYGEEENKIYIEVQVDKKQLVEAFYNSYIEFTLSDRYIQGEWEKHNGKGYDGLPAKEFKSQIIEKFLNENK